MGRAVWPLLFVVALWGCDEEKEGASCANDGECERGLICDDGACVEIRCNGLQDCPGSGRTCIGGEVNSCSIKECNDDNGRTCGRDQPICVTEGGHRNSCVSGECTGQAECDELGAGFQCCNGACSTMCGDMFVIPVGDMGVDGDTSVAPDGGAADGAVEPDGGAPPMGGGLCAPCGNDADCADLGEGARCTPLGGDQVCSSACAGPDDCPAGFQCVEGLNQCLPISFECGGCLAEPCPAGEICNFANGECTAPRGECGLCTGDADCAEGLTCGPLGGQQHCFEPCEADACPAGQMCADGLCKPSTGLCDACAGLCAGDTPACIEAEARCAQCGPGVPCAPPLSCNGATFTCEEGGAGCNGDVDCVAPNPVCFGGECVACLTDDDCPPRNACTAEQTCIPDNCRGVACQAMSMCNDDTGLCEPGCQNNMDCMTEEMRCNVMTGQCYYADGTCDLDAAAAVCGPGSRCEPGLAGIIHGPTRGNCSCTPNPDPNQTGCQPGTICNDGSMFMLPSSCGINIFMPPP